MQKNVSVHPKNQCQIKYKVKLALFRPNSNLSDLFKLKKKPSSKRPKF